VQSLSGWIMTICTGALICGVMSALIPHGTYAKMMDTVLGVFMLCCFLIPAGMNFSLPSPDISAAEEKRLESASSTGDYFLFRAQEKTREAAHRIILARLSEYGINEDETEIYIGTEETSSAAELFAEVKLPQRVSDKHDEIKRILEYELGMKTRLEYGQVTV